MLHYSFISSCIIFLLQPSFFYQLYQRGEGLLHPQNANHVFSVQLHNESINVWTHSLGMFSVLYSLLACLRNLDLQSENHARCVLFFGVCCLVNLALSAIGKIVFSSNVTVLMTYNLFYIYI